MKQTIRINESQLRQVIKESIKKALKENFRTGWDGGVLVNPIEYKKRYPTFKSFMENYYDNDETCVDAIRQLQGTPLRNLYDLYEVFHEGLGDGLYCPEEGIIAVFDEDDVPEYHSVSFFKYDPRAWFGYEELKSGKENREMSDTEQYDVEPIDESRLKSIIKESIKNALGY